MDDKLRKAYSGGHRRLVLLDYDGTLVDFASRPEDAPPTPELRTLLMTLATDPDNTVVVISGRDRATLDSWLGDLPITMAAEHGAFLRVPGGNWIGDAGPGEWKGAVRKLMDGACKNTVGSMIEEKSSSLVWHYIRSDGAAGSRQAVELTSALEPIASRFGLRVMHGHYVVEVMSGQSDKGVAAHKLMADNPTDFILAAGDDATDEDMFAALPDDAVSIKVGAGPSLATRQVGSPAQLLALLRAFAGLDAKGSPKTR